MYKFAGGESRGDKRISVFFGKKNTFSTLFEAVFTHLLAVKERSQVFGSTEVNHHHQTPFRISLRY